MVVPVWFDGSQLSPLIIKKNKQIKEKTNSPWLWNRPLLPAPKNSIKLSC